MKTTNVNSFDQTLKYKLYRTVYEIIHPTISKKNISSYRIVFNDDVLPVRVFYPKKVSNISRVIIYVPGVTEVTGCLGDYAEICRNISHETEELVIALDLDDIDSSSFLDVFDWCYRSFLYLRTELEKLGILDNNITLMGDSIGASTILGIVRKSGTKDSRLVLFYPVVSDACLDKSSKGIDSLVIKKIKKFYKEHVKNYNGTLGIVMEVRDKDNNILKAVGDTLVEIMNPGFVFFANIKGEDSVNFIVRSNCSVNAGLIAKEASIVAGGNGGGSPTFAQGGGKDASKVSEVLENVENSLRHE